MRTPGEIPRHFGVSRSTRKYSVGIRRQDPPYEKAIREEFLWKAILRIHSVTPGIFDPSPCGRFAETPAAGL